ncbi:MAG: hypothetical protein AVDCRST_MAG19-2072 [uncultured Thermomicrobiales bacterium]|uniref:GH26 domain-containing protein n=1 Tax=uncultured Thermomicrobiales bacterium TaxID=1645740 RepID=A0A6J4V1C2_9BACT|nr:MAG: hypothetical protein AVDCRST_MAG19-2072 [uncultured Thermomicrobiales bacterium]
MGGRARFRGRFGAALGLVAIVGLVVALPIAGSGPRDGQKAVSPAAPAAPERGTLWVQDNNLAQAGGITPDFKEMFTTRTEEWARAREFVGVYLLRSTSLRNPENRIDDAFLRDAFLPNLVAWGIDLGVDVVGAGHLQCPGKERVMLEEAEQIDRIERLGGEVRYLSLQSVLSKPSNVCPAYGRDAGYDLRIADIVRYIGFMKGRYPGIQVGLVDAMPAKGWAYEAVYEELVGALRAKGLTLAFLHLDFPMESASAGWANARAAEALVRTRLGVRFGLLYVSKEGGRTSNEAFYANVLAAHDAYRAAGGRPDNLILTSWYPHPTVNLPEDAADDAPFMKLVLDFARLGGTTARAG